MCVCVWERERERTGKSRAVTSQSLSWVQCEAVTGGVIAVSLPPPSPQSPPPIPAPIPSLVIYPLTSCTPLTATPPPPQPLVRQVTCVRSSLAVSIYHLLYYRFTEAWTHHLLFLLPQLWESWLRSVWDPAPTLTVTTDTTTACHYYRGDRFCSHGSRCWHDLGLLHSSQDSPHPFTGYILCCVHTRFLQVVLIQARIKNLDAGNREDIKDTMKNPFKKSQVRELLYERVQEETILSSGWDLINAIIMR